MDYVEITKEVSKYIIEIVRVLAWPTIAGMTLLSVKPYMGKLAESFSLRGMKIKGFGVEAKIDAIEQQKEAHNNADIASLPTTGVTAAGSTSGALTAQPPDNPQRPAVALLQQQIKVNLEKAGLDTGRQNALLLRELAETRLRAGHEFIYNRIFGSQILALKRLDERGDIGASIADARAFFEPYNRAFPDFYSSYGFDGWLNFMVVNLLVERNGDHLKATEFGHDFLLYVVDSRLSVEKSL
jgi:hypothetical protein